MYDAENRLIATAGYSYIYDAEGQRVEKCTEGSMPGTCASGATGTLYWRGLGSDTLRETDLAGNLQNNYIFFNGQRVARSDSAGAPHYYFSDHLGSHGVVETVTTSGTVSCDQDIDYYPYGGVQTDYCSGSGAAQNYKFNGKERDAEGGLDNFGARYDSSSLGRFMTPDWAAKPVTVPYAKFGDPQTPNLYSYVENGPVNRIDPDGHDDEAPASSSGAQTQSPANPGQAAKQTPQPQVSAGVRQLDPNSQECKDLAKKMDNIATDIIKRDKEVAANPLGLPEKAAPGSAPRDSVDGHRQIIRDLIDNLGAAADLYNNKCGGGPPPPLAPVTAPSPSPAPSKSPTSISPSTAVVVGVIVVGTAAIALAPVTGGLSLAAVAF